MCIIRSVDTVCQLLKGKMITLSLVLVFITVQWSWAQQDPLLPFSEHLDLEHKVRLKWGFDEIRDTILFELTFNTVGWVGFGFSPKGGMTGADVVIGGVGPKGSYFTDRHAVGTSIPLVDKQQNSKLLSLTESDGKTVMKFQRSITSCDENDLPITDLPMKLIYAYGETDEIAYHGNRRGTKELNLLKYMPQSNPPNSNFFDITMANFTVPANQTYYHCKIMKTPTFDHKRHIYRIAPVITNIDLVHHLALYLCPPSVTEPSEAQCTASIITALCMEMVAVWAVGGEAFQLPEAAGLPIGGNIKDYFYRLEVHYNNHNKLTGRVDSSGLRLYYTSELRQHDAGILITGLAVAPGYAIPPKAKSFLTYGLCDTAYIPKVLKTSNDLQVFSVMLHTHLAGRKLRVGHFRGGKQIDFLAKDENYDFDYQEVTNLGKTKIVKLGDKLLVECTYNTENRNTLTWGGFSTSDEMCLAFLFYYPVMNLSTCVSLPNTTTLISEMGAKDQDTWLKMMSTKTWTDTSINQYQQTLKRINQLVIVMNSNNNMSSSSGLIPDLEAIPSESCVSSSATKSLSNQDTTKDLHDNHHLHHLCPT
ncbi:DBH-like monooxygenase protein 2 homolog [Puntigrus tetrazona]|uniref:DBH-like monooxygenase protein 2 homolog n=1 Tax=Puntigrus tetrazona TaxID=1606681 RepID=UPI001C8AD803|nr:DBH-like monooxygenase protein 2 homolog [Puntigrus tetrazona]